VQVSVDAAEMVIGLEHPGGGPAQRHLPSCERLTFLECFLPVSIDDSIGLVERRVRGRVGGTPSRRWSASLTFLSCAAGSAG
jgi:hypothetical protein